MEEVRVLVDPIYFLIDPKIEISRFFISFSAENYDKHNSVAVNPNMQDISSILAIFPY